MLTRDESRGRELCAILKDLIPKQVISICYSSSIGDKIIAMENVKAMRKEILAKFYGRDITRKRKLLEKQKFGKTMIHIGNEAIPQFSLIAALKVGDN